MSRSPRPTAAATTPRSRKGFATRERLLQGAKAVFEETGFLEARITDIADRAGLSHGSFYHYFDSKEQAFREVAEAQEALLTASDEAGDAQDDAGTGNDANADTAHDASTNDPGTENSDTTAGTDDPGTGNSDTTAGTNDNAVDGAAPDLTAGPAAEIERIRRANRRYLERYRDNGRIMGVIEEVSRYDDHVNDARMRRQKHFADRAEQAIRRLQADGLADAQVDPEIAALALGSMMGRFAELWLVEEWGDFDFDDAVDQMTRLWANAIGLHQGTEPAPTPATPMQAKATSVRRGRPATRAPGAADAATRTRPAKPAAGRGPTSATSGATKTTKSAKATTTRSRAR